MRAFPINVLHALRFRGLIRMLMLWQALVSASIFEIVLRKCWVREFYPPILRSATPQLVIF